MTNPSRVQPSPERNLSQLQPTKAVILAAGKGKRLRPYTETRPKPLLPANGRPILDTILQALSIAGIGDVCLVTGYLGEQIEQHVGTGAPWKIRASYSRQQDFPGTAGALRAARSFVTGPCLVIGADYILPKRHLQDLKLAYLEAGADLFASLRRVPLEEISRRNSVRLGSHNTILEIVEKPKPVDAPSHAGTSLMFVVPKAICNYLEELNRSQRGEYELTDVLNRMLEDGYRMGGLWQEPPDEWHP